MKQNSKLRRGKLFVLLAAFLLSGCLVTEQPGERAAEPPGPADTSVSAEKSGAASDNYTPVPSVPAQPEPERASELCVRFIDVGQADCALLECDGRYMLIDGGNRNDSSLIYSVLKSLKVSHLDIVVGTHAHEDHIGGIPGAYEYATADMTLSPVTEYTTETFEKFAAAARSRGGGLTVPEVGDTYSLGAAEVTILGRNSGKETNDTSIVLKVRLGQVAFLFTGDAERGAEEVILESGADLSAAVLKVGHHGSSSSTSYPFLRQILPVYAVISVGRDNDYGHPDEEVLSRLDAAEADILRTDELGDIVFTTDGRTIRYYTGRNAASAASGKQSGSVGPVQSPEDGPAPEKLPEPQTELVWISENGKKYHAHPQCSNIKNPSQVTLSRAESGGYTPCKKCF